MLGPHLNLGVGFWTAFMYTYIYALVCIGVYIPKLVCTYVYMHINIHTHMCTYTCTCVYVNLCARACECAWLGVFTYLHMYKLQTPVAYRSLRERFYVIIYIYTYIYVCVYIYLCKYAQIVPVAAVKWTPYGFYRTATAVLPGPHSSCLHLQGL